MLNGQFTLRIDAVPVPATGADRDDLLSRQEGSLQSDRSVEQGSGNRPSGNQQMGSAGSGNVAGVSRVRFLGVPDLPEMARRYGLRWYHLPIVDASIPDGDFEIAWQTVGVELREILLEGGKIVIHCRGGLGRTGMIAARLLVELGMEPEAAIKAVRKVRPGAIQTISQEEYVRRCEAFR
jgi:hypothetical protein